MEFSTPKYNFELSDCLISNLQAFNISFRKYLSKRVNKPNLIHLEKPVHKCLSVNQFKHVGWVCKWVDIQSCGFSKSK